MRSAGPRLPDTTSPKRSGVACALVATGASTQSAANATSVATLVTSLHGRMNRGPDALLGIGLRERVLYLPEAALLHECHEEGLEHAHLHAREAVQEAAAQDVELQEAKPWAQR